MSLKRSLDSTPLDGPATKRRLHSASLPVTPNALLSTPLRTPRTPYPSRPSDSPSNPFGRKRTRHLTRSLPESTSFSKHLPLRFQFIRTGSTSPRQGGVYRIVQVPLSYTFTHLRCLISWLYRGLPDQTTRDEHLFEVQKDVTSYSSLYKPGQVKSGQTWVKLSSSQNPYRYRGNYLNDDEEDLEEEDELSSSSEEDVRKDDNDDVCEDEEFEDWKWEDEEEFTVGHAWPKGPDLERAIIYHHSLTTQVHITINQLAIPRRKGRSNTPYVFAARGRVWLSPPPLPRPIFAVTAKKIQSPGWKRKVSPKFTQVENWDDDSAEEDDEDDNDTEDVNAEVDPDYWNESRDGFARFLARYMASVLPISTPSLSMDNFDHEAEYTSDGDTLAYPSTPGLTRSSSVPSSPITNLATSSPSTSSSMPVRIVSPSKSPSEDEDEEGYITLSLPAITPFPIKARPIRKRMERIEKRMGKLKKDKWLCQHDDKDEEEDEDDELADDDGDDDENTAPTKINFRNNKGLRKQEDVQLDWDPFGEEEEL